MFVATAILGACSMTMYAAGDPAAGEVVGEPAMDAGGTDAGRAWGDEPWANPENWPGRWSVWSGLKRSTLAASAAKPMGVILPILGPVRPMRSTPASAAQVEADQSADVNALMQRRRVRLGDAVVRFEGEGRGSFVFLSVPPDERAEVAEKATFYLKFISGREVTAAEVQARAEEASDGEKNSPRGGLVEDVRSGPAARLVQIERTWFVYYAPDEGSAAEKIGRPRGVAVLMPGLFGTPDSAILPMIRSLRARGWGVMRMLAHSSRFTEKATFTINPGDDLDALGKRIAATLTGRAAECAYSVQAAMLYLRQERPETIQSPKVLIGMSGGAMILPTVMAREPSAYDGAVCIAGGADYLRVALDSNYTNWVDAVRFEFVGEAKNDATRKALVEAYHKYAPLDTMETSRVLRGKPVLMLHGASDNAVPAAMGDEMWRLAGMPERWVFNTGHELLFMQLPFHMVRLMDWLDTHTPAVSSAPIVAPTSDAVPARSAVNQPATTPPATKPADGAATPVSIVCPMAVGGPA